MLRLKGQQNRGLSLTSLILLFLLLCPIEGWGTCTVSTTAVNFGAYNPLDGINLDSTGTITVNCDVGSQVMISLGVSPTSGGFNPRQMRQSTGTDLMNYNLYTTSAHTTIWGDGTQGTATVSNTVNKNKAWNATVYGRIPPSQDVYFGSYGETLVVTINY
jgi:spore coat protein U-like protein